MGIVTRIHESSDGLAFERIQDVEPIIDFAHVQRVKRDIGSSEMRHAASIPMVLVEAYCNDKQITFAEFMGNGEHIKTMCNDPALNAFRIWEGRV